MVIVTKATYHHCFFYFQGSGVPISCCATWSGSMCKVHIALKELQAVKIMSHKMVFQLSSNVIALPLDDGSAKTYLCNQGHASSFLSRLACHILFPANKHGINLIAVYIPTNLNVEAYYLSCGRLVTEWYLLSHITWTTLHLWTQL